MQTTVCGPQIALSLLNAFRQHTFSELGARPVLGTRDREILG